MKSAAKASRPSVNPFGRTLLAVLTLVWSIAPTWIAANPAGEQVISGDALFSRSGGQLTIDQLTDQAIIHWEGFSINAGELTVFNQPGVHAAVLNRVISDNPSAIHGTLQANGQVFLINTNGILVGPSGVINAASFVASTLDLADGAFLAAGEMTFSGNSTAGIVNQGTIEALGGDVFLFARTVDNSGSIRAGDGTVGLASGTEVMLTAGAADPVVVLAGSYDNESEAAIDNSGTIDAVNVDLEAVGGNMYALAINNSGLISATEVDDSGGTVRLVASTGTVTNSGTITVASEDGDAGSVQMLGDQVGQFGRIDATGATAGGEVLIGGDYLGDNPEIKNATNTSVTGTIEADALDTGNGGRVIVWSDEYTNFTGTISARGGVSGGNGGFVETSSKDNLQALGSVDASAAAGQAGEWLLDPRDVTITSSTTNGAFDSGNPNTFTPTGDSATVLNSTIQTSLEGGTSVTITTGATGSQSGDITIAATISPTMNSGDATLTFTAANNIVQNDITASILAGGTNKLNVVFNATGSVTLGSTINTNGGNLTSSGTSFTTQSVGVITTTGGNVDLSGHSAAVTIGLPVTTTGGTAGSGGTFTSAGTTFTNNGSITTDGGNVTINNTGNITVNQSINASSTASATGLVDINSSAAVDINAAISTAESGFASDGTTFDNTSGSITTQGNGGVTLTHSGAITIGANIDADAGSGAVALNGSSTVDIDATVDAGTGGFDIADTAGTVSLNGAVTAASGGNVDFGNNPVTLESSKSVTASGAGNITFGSTLNGDGGSDILTINSATGVVTVSGAVGGTQGLGGITVNSTSGTVTFSSTIDDTNDIGTALNMDTGTGDLLFSGVIGGGTGVASLSVTDADDVTLAGIGDADTVGVDGTTAISADGSTGITFSGTTYKTNQASYTATAGSFVHSGGATTTHTTTADTVTFTTGAIALGASSNLVINSTGGAVTTAAITGAGGETVTIDTGNASAGSINVGAIGAGGNIGNITLEAGTDSLVTSSTLKSSGAIDLDGDSAVTIGGTATTTSAGAITVDTGGTLSVTGGFDSTNAGAANAGSITLTATGGITLTGNTTITTNGTGSNDVDFTLSPAVNATSAGSQTLGIDTGTANLTTSSTLGATTRLGALTLTGDQINIDGNVEATGVTVVATGTTELIDFTGVTIDANTGNVFLSGDSITFGTSLVSTGASGTTTATIVGDTQASTITVGTGAGSDGNLVISEADINTIGATFSDVIIGSASADGTVGSEAQADQSGAITVNAADATLNYSNASLNFRGVAAATTLTSAIDTSAATDANVTLQGTTVHLDNNISTDSGDVTITGAAEINAAVSIDSESGGDSTAGNVSFSSTIVAQDGTTDSLTIDATGGTHGTVTVTGNIGDGTTGNDLDGFTVTQALQVDLANVQVDAANIAVTGTNIDLNGTTYKANTSGSITFTGAVDLEAGGSTITVQTNTADADDITFTSTIDDTSSDDTLVLNANNGGGAPGGQSGDITLSGNVGATNSIGVLTISGGDDVTISGNTVTSAGAISITSDTVALGGTANTTTITSGGAATEDITIAGTIDDTGNDTDLVLDAGASGDITLSSAVGGTNAIDGFFVSNAQDLNIQAVTVDGASGSDSIDIGTASAVDGTLTLNGNLSTAGAAGGNATGNIDINASGTVTLASSVTLNTGNASGDNSGNITVRGGGTLSSSVAFQEGLTLDADDAGGGTEGAVDVSAITMSNLDHLDVTAASFTIGDTTLGDGANNGNVGLDVNTSGDFTINGDISTAGDSSNNAGGIDLAGVTGNIILNGGGASDANTVTITTDVSGTDQDVSFGAVRDGASDIGLTVTTGTGDITFSSTVGDDDAIGALDLRGNDIALTGGDVEVSSITIMATSGGDDESIDWTGRTLDANGGDVFLSSDFITFGTSVTSTGASGTTKLTLVGDTNASTITINNGAGSNGALEFSEADVATINSTFSDVIIGSASADGTVGGEAQADQSGAITINANDGTLNVSQTSTTFNFRGTAAATTLTSAFDATGGDANITLQGTTVHLDNNISTDVGNITVTGAAEVNGAITLDTENGAGGHNGGNVSFSSTIVAQDGTTDTLTVNTTGSSGTNGTITITGNIGDGTTGNDLDGLSLAGATQIDVASINVDNGDIGIEGDNIDLNGAAITINNGTGDDTITFDGDVDLEAATVTITGGSNAGDTISFIDDTNGSGDINSITSNRNLVVAGGAAPVTFEDALGATLALASLDVNTSGTVTFMGNVSTTGNIALDGATGAIDFNKAGTTFVFSSTTGNIDLSGSSGIIDSATVAELQFDTSAGTVSLPSITLNAGGADLLDVNSSGNTTLNGDISLDGTGGIDFAGVGGTLILAEGNTQSMAIDTDGDFTSTGVTINATNATAEDLSISAAGSVTLGTVNLNGGTADGDLVVASDDDNNGTTSVTLNGTISEVNLATFGGGGTGTNDTVDINADITTTGGALTLQNAAAVNVDASAARTLTSAGAITATSNITTIQLDNGSSLVTFTNGTSDGDIALGAIADDATGGVAADLTITSSGNVTLSTVSLNDSTDGDLIVTVDSDDNDAEAETLTIGGAITNTALVTLNGGFTANSDDIIDINADITTGGALTITDANNVQVDASAARTITSGGAITATSNVEGIQLDNGTNLVTITNGTSDGDIALAAITDDAAGGTAADLTITSSGNVTLSTVSLNDTADGDLVVTVDSDDNDAEAETLTIGGAITDVALVTLNGGFSANSDDIIDINANITTGGALTITDANNVQVDASAARTITSGGAITATSNVEGIQLDNGTSLVTFTNGTSDGDIALTAITDDAAGGTAADLTITSSGNVTLSTVSLNDGTDGDLIVTVDSDDADAEVETLTIGGAITDVALITLNGGFTADSDDIIDINADMTSTTGAITIADADQVQIDASAARTLTAGAAFTANSNVDGIQLNNGSNTVTIASGSDGTVSLGAVTDDGAGGTAANLTVNSEGTISMSTISLNDTADGALSLTVDSDNADAEAMTLTIGNAISNVASVTLSGGFAANSDDIIDINADITTTNGAITIQNADSVQLDASAARTLTAAGNITATSNVEGIQLNNGTNLVTLTTGTSDGDVSLAAVTDDAAGGTAADLTITSSGNVTLSTVSLNDTADGDLIVTVDSDDNDAEVEVLTLNGAITDVALVTLNGGFTANSDDTIDINADITTTTGAITITDANQVQIDASAARTITSGGAITATANVEDIQLNNGSSLVTITNGTSDGDIALGAITDDATGGTAADLTVTSSGNVTLSTVSLNDSTDGDLIVTVDSDDNDAEAETLTIGGAITNTALVTLNGGFTANSDDIIDINADITTGGALTITDANNVQIDASAARTITSGGAITATSNVEGLQLDNGTNLVTLTNGTSDGDIALAAITDDAAGGTAADLTITSSGNVTLSTVSLNDGTDGDLIVTVDSDDNDAEVEVLTIGGAITDVALVTLNGGFSADSDDTIDINADITTTTGAITIADVNQVQLDASAARTITSGGAITATSNVDGIQLNNGTNLVTITNGTSDGDIALGAITDDGAGGTAADLTVTSSGNVTLSTVSLDDGTDGDLIVTVDSDDADAEAETLTIGGAITNTALVTLNGGFTANSDDIIDINADITTGGALTITDANNVQIDASAARTLTSGGAITATSNVEGLQLDNGSSLVTLTNGTSDGDIALAAITDDAAGGTAADLTITSSGNVTLSTVSLNDSTDGDLVVTVDSDDNDAEVEVLTVGGAISDVALVTLNGGFSADSDDTIDINANITTTTGAITIADVNQVQIDASAARTITSGGAITATSNVDGIQLNNGTSLVTLTNGTSDGDIALGAITDDAAGGTAADLTITSSGNVTLSTVSLDDTADGDLVVTVDSDDNDAEAETLTIGGAITNTALVTLNGGFSANSDDIIDINADITTGGALTITDANNVQVDASAARTITSGGAITATSNVEGIQLDNGTNTVTFTNGTSDGDIALTAITDDAAGGTAADLTITSSGNVTLSTVSLNDTTDGDLIVTVDSDDADAEAETLTIGGAITDVALITLNGGFTADSDDIIDINADMTSTTGAITIADAHQVQLDASAARTLTAGAAFTANSNVDGIQLNNGTNTVTIATNNDGNVTLGAVTDDGAGGTAAALTVSSQGTISYTSIALDDTADGALSLTVDSDNADAEAMTLTVANISNVASLTLSGGFTANSDDIIDINADISTTGGNMIIQNADVVRIDASAARAISAVGSITATSNVDGIQLDNGTNTVTISTTNDGDIALGAITDDAAGGTAADLTITSQGNVTLSTVSLDDGTDGDLIVTVDSDDNDAEAETLTIGGAITNTALVTLNGGFTANSDDIIDINADITTGGALTITDANNVQVDASAARTLTSGGAITATSNVEGIQLDNGTSLVTLTNGTSDGDIALTAITDDAAGGTAADLTITSSGNVTLSTVSLNDSTDGDLIVTVDSDDNDAEVEVLTVGGAISDVALVTLNGGFSADSDDTIDINANITTTTGAITIADVNQVQIDASAARTITSGGAITATSNVDGIQLNNGTSLVTITNGTSDGDIALGAITDDAAGGTAADLTITSSGNVTLSTVSLDDTADGDLIVTVDSDDNDAEAETLTIGGAITNTALVTLNGGFSANSDDIIDINADITTGGALTITDANNVQVDASAARTITSGGAITATSNVEGIQLDNGTNLVTFTNGTSDGDIALTAITDDAAGGTAADLTVTSSGNVTLSTVSLNDTNDGDLIVTVDSDDNDAEAETLTIGGAITDVALITLNGGFTADSDDIIDINADMTSTTGAITIADAHQVQLDASAARTLTSGAAFTANSNVDGIQLNNGSNTVTIASGNDGDVTLGAVTDDASGGTAANLTVNSQGNITLTTVSLNDSTDGALSLTVDSDDADAEAETLTIGGNITDIASLSLSGGFTANSDDIIDINADITTTSGAITIADADQVQIDASAARTITSGGAITATSNVEGIQLNNGTNLVTITNGTSDGDIALGAITDDAAGGTAADLTITSSGNVTLSTVSLDDGTDGDLIVTVDSDDNDAEAETLTIGGAITNTALVTLNGGFTANSDDIIDINADITTGGALTITDANNVQVDASAARTITSGGAITATSNVEGIQLDNGTNTVTFTNGTSDGDIALTAITDDATGGTAADLTITSSGNVTLSTVSLNDGTDGDLVVTVDSDDNDAEAETLTIGGAITDVALITLNGGFTANSDDIIDINADMTSTTGAITIADADQVQLDASAARTLTAGAAFTANSNIDGIQLNNGSNTVTIASGSDGAVTLGAVTDDAAGGTAANLTVSSQGGITFTSISLNDTTDGSLSLTVDSDNNDAETETLTVANISNVGAVTLSGGFAANSDDIIDINQDINATAGAITIQNADVVRVDASAARALTAAGNITATSNVDGIQLDNGSNTVTVTTTNDGNVSLGAITDDAAGGTAADLTISSQGDVTLSTVSLNDTNDGDLIVTADSDNADAEVETLTIGGAITNVALVTLNGGFTANSDDTIDINADITTTTGAITITNANQVQVDASAARTITSAAGITATSNVEDIQLNNGSSLVTITNGTSDGDIALGAISDDAAGGTAADLAITSSGNVTLSTVSLNDTTDGDLTVTVDSDDNDAEAETLTIGGAITNVAATTLQGGFTANSDDIIDINADITTTGALTLADANNVQIDASATRTITSGGAITATSNLEGIQLDNGTSTVTITNGTSDGDIALTAITDDAAGGTAADLTVTSSGNVTLSTVSLNDGTDGDLVVTVDSDNNDAEAETLTIGGAITDVALVTLNGGFTANSDDIIDINADITTTTGAITMTNADSIKLDASAARTITSGGAITATSNVDGIQLDNGSNTVTITNGTSDGDIALGAITDDAAGGTAADLTVTSSGNVTLSTVSLNDTTDGDLVVTVDSDDNDAEAETLTIGGAITNVALVTLNGGFTANSDDIIDVNADITTTTGAITIADADQVQLDASAARTLTSAAAFTANSNIDGIQLNNGSNTVTISSGNDGAVSLGAVTDDATGGTAANLTVSSQGGISFTSISLNDTTDGSLSLTVDSDNADGETETLTVSNISNVGAVTLSGGFTANSDDIIDINQDINATAGAVTIQNADVVRIDASAARGISAAGNITATSNVDGIQLDNGSSLVTITTTNDGNVSLGAITDDAAGGTAADLTISSQGDVTLSTVSLNDATDGDLIVTADSDNADAEVETLTIGGAVTNVALLTLNGGFTANSDDIIDINADLTTTTGAITMTNADSIKIDASAARTITSAAAITMSSNVDGIQLDNGSNTVTFTNGTSDGDITLGAVTDDAAGGTAADLTITSSGNVTLSSVSLNDTTDGDLVVTVDSDNNDAEVETLAINGTVSDVALITLTGGFTADSDDVIDINGNLASTTGAITFSNANQIQFDASSARTVSSAAALTATSNIDGIQLNNGSNTVTLSSGNDGDISLVAVTDDATGGTAAGLTVSSEGNISVTSISLDDATDGALSLTVDSDNADAEAETLAVSGIVNVASIALSGGFTANSDDIIDIDQNLTATNGGITIQNADQVKVDMSAARSFTAEGSIAANSNVDGILLENGSNTLTVDANNEGSVSLGAISDDATGGTAADLTVTAEGSVTLASTVSLNDTTDGTVTITADDDNDSTATLQVAGAVTNVNDITLQGGGTGTNDTVDIDADITTTAGNLIVQNASAVQIDASAARGLTSANALTINSNVSSISLNNGGNTVTLTTTAANDGAVTLAKVETDDGTTGAALTVSSAGDVTFNSTVDLNGTTTDGVLTVTADSDNDGTTTITQNGTINQIASATIGAGGTGTNDTYDVNGSIETTVGDLKVENLSSIKLSSGNYTAQGSVDFSDDDLGPLDIDSTGAVKVTANTGNIDMTGLTETTDSAAVSELEFNSVNGSTSLGKITLDAGGSDLFDANTKGNLSLEGDISLAGTGGVELNEVAADDINSSVQLAEGAGATTTITTGGAFESDLTRFTSLNSSAEDLTIKAGGNVTLGAVDLIGGGGTNGSLSVTANTDDNNVDTLKVAGEVKNVADATLAGSTTGAQSIIDIDANITTTVGDLNVTNASSVLVDTTTVRTLTSAAGMNMATDVTGVTFDGGGQATTLTMVSGTSSFAPLNGSTDLAINASGSSLSLNTVGSSTPLNSLTISGSSTTLNGNVTTNTSTGVVMSGTSNTTLNGDITIDTSGGGGAISLGSSVDGGSLALTAGSGNVTLNNVGSGSSLNSLTLNTSGTTEANGSVSASSASLTTGGSLTFSDGLNIGTLTVSTGGGFTATSSTDIGTIAGFTAGGAVNIIDSSGLTISGTVNTGTNTLSLQTVGGNLTLDGNAVITAGDLTLATDGTFVNNAPDGSIVTSGNFTLTAPETSGSTNTTTTGGGTGSNPTLSEPGTTVTGSSSSTATGGAAVTAATTGGGTTVVVTGSNPTNIVSETAALGTTPVSTPTTTSSTSPAVTGGVPTTATTTVSAGTTSLASGGDAVATTVNVGGVPITMVSSEAAVADANTVAADDATDTGIDGAAISNAFVMDSSTVGDESESEEEEEEEGGEGGEG